MLNEVNSFNGLTAGEIEIPDYYFNRTVTNVPVFDNLFGGIGWLPGSVATISAPKGGGKTTFLLTLLQKYTEQEYRTSYASAEEDVIQIAFNCRRIGVMNVGLYNYNSVDDVIEMAENRKVQILVVDSLQKFAKNQSEQIKATEKLIKFAKKSLCCVAIVLHSTKTGQVKGNSSIEHDVDINIKIDIGDPEFYGDSTARVFSTSKNRFGNTVELGNIVMRLGATGFNYEHPVANGEVTFTPTPLSLTEKKKMEKKEKMTEILNFVKINDTVTIADAYKFIDDVPKIKRYLREFCEAGVLEKEGKGQSCVWVLTPDYK